MDLYTQILYGPLVVRPTHYTITDVPLEKFTSEELEELRKISEESYEIGLKLNELVDKK